VRNKCDSQTINHPELLQPEVISGMNKEMLQGNWTDLKGKIKEKWGKLTDDDLKIIEGKRDQIAGKLQERYGYAKEQAQKELDEFCNGGGHCN
jgi:uncharacterized protein YjbJ (UPF0337 family)